MCQVQVNIILVLTMQKIVRVALKSEQAKEQENGTQKMCQVQATIKSITV